MLSLRFCFDMIFSDGNYSVLIVLTGLNQLNTNKESTSCKAGLVVRVSE